MNIKGPTVHRATNVRRTVFVPYTTRRKTNPCTSTWAPVHQPLLAKVLLLKWRIATSQEETIKRLYFAGICPVLKVRSGRSDRTFSELFFNVVQRLEHKSPIQKNCKTSGNMLSAYALADESSMKAKEGRNFENVWNWGRITRWRRHS